MKPECRIGYFTRQLEYSEPWQQLSLPEGTNANIMFLFMEVFDRRTLNLSLVTERTHKWFSFTVTVYLFKTSLPFSN